MSDLTSQYVIAQEEHDYNKKYEEGTIVKHTIDNVTTAYTAKKNVPQFISILNENYWKKIASTTISGGGGVDIFDEDVVATDAQRNKALANVSNQTANSTTGKMGYKVLDPTKTFAEQVTAENTIYEIRDVFDLGTDDGVSVNVTIPNNCTLKFNGGRLKNGRIDLNNCYVDSNGICFEKSVAFGTPNMQSNATTVANTTIYTRWFDFVSADDEFTDYATATRNPNPTDNIICFKQLQRIISNGKNVEFESNQYLQSTITTPTTYHGSAPNNGNSIFFLKDAKDVKINLNGTTLKLLKVTSVRMYAFLLVGSDIELHNGKVIGNTYGFGYPEYIYNGETLRFYGYGSLICQIGGNFTIHDIEVSQGLCDGVHLGASYYRGSVVMGSYNMYNCQIHDVGRNGLHLSSSEYGNLDNVTIYNISVGNKDYDDPDPSNIYPYSPSAGIDVEFEDRYYVSESSYVDPIMNLSNLDIYNCRVLTIGSSTANAAIPTVKTFNLKNSNLKGKLQPSGIIGDKVSVESCYINGAVNLGSSSIMNDCTIELRSSSGNFYASNSLLNNCIIRDYTNDGQWNMLGDDSIKAIFNKCDIKVHSMNFGVSTFTDCTIESENNTINCKEIFFKGCTIKNYRIGGNSTQSPSVVHLINCDCEAISNIERTMYIYAENSSFRNTRLTTIGLADFQQCCFEEFRYTISTSTTATTHFVMLGCNGILLSAPYKYLEIKNSNIVFKNTSNVPAFAQQNISVINSIISDDNNVNIAATWKATIVAFNSCFNIAKNYNTTNFNLSKCVINSTQSNFTEIGFLGVAKQCLFTDSIPTHGDSSSRPSASDIPNTYAGFTYFDETLGLPLYLKVDVDTTDPDNPVYTKSWIKADGTALS